MESTNRYDSVDPRAVRFIRYHARRLAALQAIPAWQVEDYEQDLITDLLARDHRFDPARASRATFADRIIRHRVATLIGAGGRLRRADEKAAAMADDEDQILGAEEHSSLCLDIERFIGGPPDRLRCCCHWLTAENRRAAAIAAGMHRSSLYQAARDLKQRAIEVGLDAYLAGASPTLSTPAR